MSEERIWSKDFIILSMINVLLALIFYLLLVTIALYCVSKFQAPASVAGLISGIFVIGVLFGRLGTGRIIDNVGNRKIFIIGIFFFTITTACYLMSNNLTSLIIIRLSQGVAFGVAATAIGTIIARILPIHRYGEGLSYFSMSIVLATAIGPFIGIMLIKYSDFNIIFILNLILALFCLLLSFQVQEPEYGPHEKGKIKYEGRFKVTNFLEFKVLPISIIALIIAYTYSGVTTFISI